MWKGVWKSCACKTERMYETSISSFTRATLLCLPSYHTWSFSSKQCHEQHGTEQLRPWMWKGVWKPSYILIYIYIYIYTFPIKRCFANLPPASPVVRKRNRSDEEVPSRHQMPRKLVRWEPKMGVFQFRAPLKKMVNHWFTHGNYIYDIICKYYANMGGIW